MDVNIIAPMTCLNKNRLQKADGQTYIKYSNTKPTKAIKRVDEKQPAVSGIQNCNSKTAINTS